MKKSKKTIVLIASLLLAALVGFFIYKNIKEKSKYVEVKFVDGYDNKVLSTQELEVGSSAKVPEVPKHDGCNFTGWYTSDKVKVEDFKNVQKNLTVYANCDMLTFKVKFYDTIGKKVVDTQKVMYGKSAEAPDAPDHYGYNFVRWKGNYTNVKSNVTVDAIYAAQKAKFTVKYYTLDDDNNATLYTTKTYNSYVNRKVKANIISIGGYIYDSSYKANKATGRVDIDNSLVLKLYYSSRTYKITINGESNYYGYKDSVKLPNLPEKTVTLSYNENENVTNKLTSNNVDLTLVGYCKDKKSCEKKDIIVPDTNVSVTSDAEYFPIWEMDMDLILPAGEGYVEESETYTFVSWLDEENVEHQSGKSFVFDKDTILTAIYGNSSYNSTSTVKYVINTYYDGVLHSSISKIGLVGKQVLGSEFVEKIEGYNINYYTDSIFLSSNASENVIEIYYTNDEMLISSRVNENIDETVEEQTEIITVENNESEIIIEVQNEETIIEEELVTNESVDDGVINDVIEEVIEENSVIEIEENIEHHEINEEVKLDETIEEIKTEELEETNVDEDEKLIDSQINEEPILEDIEEYQNNEELLLEETVDEQEAVEKLETEVLEENITVDETRIEIESNEKEVVLTEINTNKPSKDNIVIEDIIVEKSEIKETDNIKEETLITEINTNKPSKDNIVIEDIIVEKSEIKETDNIKEETLITEIVEKEEN